MLPKFAPVSDVVREPVRKTLFVCVTCAEEWREDEHACETHVVAPDDDSVVQQCECPCGLMFEPGLETWRQWLWRRLTRRA